MSLRFKSQVIKTPEGKIKYKRFRSEGREHYHISVWVDGPEDELDQVEKVEYLLHQTFRRPLRTSRSRSNNFSITFWTWGMFVVKASIFFITGASEAVDFYLSYELPDDDGTNYIEA